MKTDKPDKTTSQAQIVRKRTRAIAHVTQASVEAKKFALEHYSKNKAMNAAKKEADTARKNLLSLMKKEGLSTFTFTTDPGSATGRAISLTAEVTTPKTMKVDIAALKGLVTPEQFLRIVTATKTAIEAEVGGTTFLLCAKEVDGTENASVKPTK